MRRRAVTRTTTLSWVIVAPVAVLNVVGLVMILSASSVAALTDYGSSWYFFDRQLAVGAHRRWSRSSSPSRARLPHLAAALAPCCSRRRSSCSLVVLVPGVGI